MKSEQRVEANYIGQLTWLRGIAAFFVIVSHTLRATEVKYSPTDEASSFLLMSIFDLGSFGVVLFFVLSGCTLYISNSDRSNSRDIISFYIKRFFRIWPAFIISLIFYLCFSFVFIAWYIEPQGHWVEQQFLSSYSLYDLFRYSTLTFNMTGPEGLFNNAYWSLPVEFQYYIIFPFIVMLVKYTGIIGPICLALLLYLLPRFGIVNFDTDVVFTLAFSFCGGVLVGYVYNTSIYRMNSLLGLSLLIILISLSSAISNSYVSLPDVPMISNKWNWFGGIAIVVVYIALVTKMSIHNKIGSFLEHYGTISYSTYLYHNLFVACAVLLIINFEIYDSGIRLLITFVFTILASYMAATLSYKYIEMPSINIGRSIVKKRYSK